MYSDIGKSILITILDVIDKNPYSTIFMSQFKSI